ncbi:MAG: hypothetical protein ACO3AD_18885, partial [Burkholderiaceae bacterium]
MANLLLFREKFDEAYRKLHGEVPQEGEEGFKDMTMAFLMCWMIWKEAEEVGAKTEREACAKVCDDLPFLTAEQCATAI